MLDLTAYDVEDEGVTRNLLIRFDLNDVTCLNASPIAKLETLVAFREDELLDGLAINSLSRLFELLVVQKVETAGSDV